MLGYRGPEALDKAEQISSVQRLDCAISGCLQGIGQYRQSLAAVYSVRGWSNDVCSSTEGPELKKAAVWKPGVEGLRRLLTWQHMIAKIHAEKPLSREGAMRRRHLPHLHAEPWRTIAYETMFVYNTCYASKWSRYCPTWRLRGRPATSFVAPQIRTEVIRPITVENPRPTAALTGLNTPPKTLTVEIIEQKGLMIMVADL